MHDTDRHREAEAGNGGAPHTHSHTTHQTHTHDRTALGGCGRTLGQAMAGGNAHDTSWVRKSAGAENTPGMIRYIGSEQARLAPLASVAAGV